MNLLHVDASVLGDHSVSRQVSAAIVARLRAEDPALAVTYRDLAAQPISHLSGLHLAAAQGAAVPAHIQEEHLAAQAALDDS
jgi:FMN-dependent NADH-azoreductase